MEGVDGSEVKNREGERERQDGRIRVEKGRGGRKRERERVILLISPLRALDKRGMRMTLALYSPSYYPCDRADLAFYLAGVFCSASHLRVAAMKISA